MDWVNETIERIAQWGKGEQGVTRLAYTTVDLQAREYIMGLMREAGLTVRVDQIGNIIGRMDGTDPNAPAVVTGSHLDTVPEGGKYDGVVGVVGGLAAIKELKARGSLTHPVELIIFAAEESSRFGFATMGSKAMAGSANLLAWGKARDQEGNSFPDVLKRCGLDFQALTNASRSPGEIKAFVELHIEQGPILEKEGVQIGVVGAIAAPTRLKITIEGMAAHSGTTPMDQRQDALVSAAMVILAVQEVASEQSHKGTVGTVGAIKVYPNVMNVIPGRVEMWVDIRGVDHESIIETLQDIKDAVSTIAEAQETPVAIEVLSSDKPVQLHSDVIEVIETACRKLGVSYRHINSGAGHDAMNMAQIAPSGMIFIPCANGISHNPDEYASPKDIEAGICVLTEVLYELAK
ncbi:amidase, hydantoinase/carbamoylase family [Thermosinus carboxydivorans Nor1]|uniref:Amidase, hydantoinase/carbamoylase family n=1 Tax=Thermosinus carboxydivorans Nor1 TaxID=401526 RepID=A1HTB7_9FIRM|nr:M20 family metallo-hydrolase [Thermosinus carboxydivorans]EAX46730.1 amidase, hydantoinase/carbamoylase family [Thermosinus carboxydivorans Nor1]